MTSHVKLRKERVGLVDYDTQIKGKKHGFVSTILNTSPSPFITPHCDWDLDVVVALCCKIRFSPRAELSEWVMFAHAPIFSLSRGALPACRPAEGVGLAAWAEEPAAAGPDGLPTTTGRDWERVCPLPGKTQWAIHLQDQEVKVILPLTANTIYYNKLAAEDTVVIYSWLFLTLTCLYFLFDIWSGRSPVLSQWLSSGWLYCPRPAKRVGTTTDWVKAAATFLSSPSHTAWNTHNALLRRYCFKCWHPTDTSPVFYYSFRESLLFVCFFFFFNGKIFMSLVVLPMPSLTQTPAVLLNSWQ